MLFWTPQTFVNQIHTRGQTITITIGQAEEQKEPKKENKKFKNKDTKPKNKRAPAGVGGPKPKIAKAAKKQQKTVKTISTTTTTTSTVSAVMEKKQCQHFKKNGVQCNNAVSKGKLKFCHLHSQKKEKKEKAGGNMPDVPPYISPLLANALGLK